MECEEIYHYPIEPNSIFDLLDCTKDTSFPFLNYNPIYPNTIHDEFSSDFDIERLLEIESNLMDFDLIDQDTNIGDETNAITQEKEKLNEKELNSLNLQEIQKVLTENNSLTDLLLTGAEAVEGENWALASSVIAKLNCLISDQENKNELFTRLATFFTQGLQYKIINFPRELFHDSIAENSADTLCAFQMLQELSPYFKFAHFTANQAILEATINDKEIHIIDFDITEGIQWPPLMIDLATRKEASLKITAILVDNRSLSIEKTGKRLKEFADSVNLPFIFDQMMMVNEEDFEKIQVSGALIANCMTNQLHMSHRGFSMMKTFLGGITKLSPKIVILVEEELFKISKITSMSFVEFFCEALHHYTALSESLASAFSGGNKLALQLIENEFLGIKIIHSVKNFPCEKREREIWGDGYASLKGFKQIPISSCNVSQARYLVTLFRGGYWVQNEGSRLSLCWKSRPLSTASIWVPSVFTI